MVSTTNLKSYYKFDETTGTTADDAHGTNDLTISGATLGATGKVGTAFSYDGSNDDTTTTTMYGIFDGSCAFSFAWWHKTASYVRTDFFNFEADRNIRIATGGSWANDVVKIQVHDGAWKQPVSSGTLTANTWYFICITYDGSGGWEMYVNNSSVSTGTTGTSLTAGSGGTNHIGQYGGNNYVFNGTLDEVQIWEEELSASSIEDLYNSGDGLAYPFTSDVTVSPSALSVSTTNQSPSYLIDITQGPISATSGILNPTISIPTFVYPSPLTLTANILTPTITSDIIDLTITGGRGTRAISRDYPNVSGLNAATNKQTDRVANLVYASSSVSTKNKVLI